MNLMRHSVPLLALFAIVCTGCGQTGALYLPDRKPGSVAETPARSDAASAERETKERQNRRGTRDLPGTDTQTPVTPPDPDRPAQTPPGSDAR